MSERYYLGDAGNQGCPICGQSVQITGDEAHHLARVMRKQAGDRVLLFDGLGNDFEAEIAAVRKDRVDLTLLARLPGIPEPVSDVTIAVALPKGDRQKWLIEKLTELGCRRVIPLNTARSVAEGTDSALSRLRRQVLEAAKQCGRSRLMQIESPHSLAELDKWAFCRYSGACVARFFAHPGDYPAAKSLSEPGGLPRIVAIGPEGGFCKEEADWLQAAGWLPVSLGPTILRVETAAMMTCVLAISR